MSGQRNVERAEATSIEEAAPDEGEAAKREEPELSAVLEALLPDEAETAPRQDAWTRLSGMRTARVVVVSGRTVMIALRGVADAVEADIAPEVDPLLIKGARERGQAALVELLAGERPLVVGLVQTEVPREIHLRAAVVHIEGDEEVLLRSGRGAVRVRADGDIEVVGSRISAASRGLFRIVGRMLRLN